MQDTPLIADSKELIGDNIAISGGLLTADRVAGASLVSAARIVERSSGVLVRGGTTFALVQAAVCPRHTRPGPPAPALFSPTDDVIRVLEWKDKSLSGAVVAISAKAGTLVIPYSTGAIIKSGSKL